MIGVPQVSDQSELANPVTAPDDRRLVAALCRGDEGAFAALLDQYHQMMLRVALLYVPNRAVAEEVVRDTWLGVLQGIGRFASRSSLKTWIFRILVDRARTRGTREGRSIPFPAFENPAGETAEPAVDPACFYPPDHEEAGWWKSHSQSREQLPESELLASETRAQIAAAIAALPPSERAVITLRDVERWPASEVCGIFGITEVNQRILLHRARAKVHQALERYLEA